MPDKTPVIFRPFKDWTGPRIGVGTKVNSELYRAVTMVPVATNEKQMKELFNLTKVQYGEKAVKNITYGIDTTLRNVIDKAMKDQGKDLNKIKFVPSDSIWFVEKKETKATKATEMKKAEQETGYTQEEMIALAKANPKK